MTVDEWRTRFPSGYERYLAQGESGHDETSD